MATTFTFIASFRGGTYCSQVQAPSVSSAVSSWIEALRATKSEIKYLGDGTIKELESQVGVEDSKPVLLNGLANVWFAIYSTKQGSFFVNIVQTETTERLRSN